MATDMARDLSTTVPETTAMATDLTTDLDLATTPDLPLMVPVQATLASSPLMVMVSPRTTTETTANLPTVATANLPTTLRAMLASTEEPSHIFL